jgi:hypothetical protein
MRRSAMTKPGGKKLVLVKNFPNRALAEAASEILRDGGIESVIQSSDTVGAGTYQGIDLYVQEGEKETARQLLESLYDGI